MKLVKTTINQVSFKLLLTFAYQISTLISIPILANSISSIEFGKIAICLILLQISWTISEWGIPNYSIELLSKSTKIAKRKFLKNIIYFHLLFFLAFTFIYAILIKFIFDDLDFKHYFFLIPSILFGIFNFSWFFSLINQTQKIVNITIFSRFIFLLAVIFLINDDSDSYLYILFQGISFAIISIYSIYVLAKLDYIDCKNFFNNIVLNLDYLKKSFIFFVTNITDNQFPLLWSFTISVVGGAPLVFLYSLADQIFRSIIAISVLISQTIRINLSFKIKKNLLFVIYLFLILGIISVILAYFYIESFLLLFFNDEFRDPIELTSIILAPAFLHFVIRLINYPLLGEYKGIDFANKLSIKIFYFSIFILLVWILFFHSLKLLIAFMSLSLFIHLLFIVFYIYRKYKVQ